MEIKLSEVAGGELEVKAQRAIEDVVKNLQDPNTPWKNKREVSIKLKFTQNEDRDDVSCDISVEKKLASAKPTATKFAIATDLDTGNVFCKEYGPNCKGQMSMDDFKENTEVIVDGKLVDSDTGEIKQDSVIDFKAKQA